MDFIEILKNLGFEGDTQKVAYAKYQRSPLWKDIREKVLERDKYKCQVCKSISELCVHHREYTEEVMSGENLDKSKIITLCKRCHNEIHTVRRRGRIFRTGTEKTEAKLWMKLNGKSINKKKGRTDTYYRKKTKKQTWRDIIQNQFDKY
jgi:5-methylcytosine-specific restriction endonuclease McrA